MAKIFGTLVILVLVDTVAADPTTCATEVATKAASDPDTALSSRLFTGSSEMTMMCFHVVRTGCAQGTSASPYLVLHRELTPAGTDPMTGAAVDATYSLSRFSYFSIDPHVSDRFHSLYFFEDKAFWAIRFATGTDSQSNLIFCPNAGSVEMTFTMSEPKVVVLESVCPAVVVAGETARFTVKTQHFATAKFFTNTDCTGSELATMLVGTNSPNFVSTTVDVTIPSSATGEAGLCYDVGRQDTTVKKVKLFDRTRSYYEKTEADKGIGTKEATVNVYHPDFDRTSEVMLVTSGATCVSSNAIQSGGSSNVQDSSTTPCVLTVTFTVSSALLTGNPEVCVKDKSGSWAKANDLVLEEGSTKEYVKCGYKLCGTLLACLPADDSRKSNTAASFCTGTAPVAAPPTGGTGSGGGSTDSDTDGDTNSNPNGNTGVAMLDSSAQASDSSGLSTSAIIGIVVGAVVLVLLVVIIAVLVWYFKFRSVKSKPSNGPLLTQGFIEPDDADMTDLTLN